MAKEPEKKGGQHRATYSRDKRMGGYIIRVEGPFSNRFAGRLVPVTLRDGTSHDEQLTDLIWTGNDEETGKPIALYHFEARPRDEAADEIPF